LSAQSPYRLALRIVNQDAAKLGFNRVVVALPFYDVTHQEVIELKKRTIEALRNLVLEKYKSTDGFDLTDLLPSYVGLPEDWSVNVNAGSNTVIDKQLPDATFIGFYGIVFEDPEPIIDRVIVYRGQDIIVNANVTKIYVDNQYPPIVYFNAPPVYGPNDTMKLELVARSSGTTRMVLLGYLITKSGTVLSSM